MDVDVIAARIHVLACPSRVDVWSAVGEEGAYPSEIAEAVNLARSTVSYHLAILKDAGLVVAVHEGRYRLYRLTRERWTVISQRELDDYLEERMSARAVEAESNV